MKNKTNASIRRIQKKNADLDKIWQIDDKTGWWMSETIGLSPQEKLKTMLMQNFGGTTKSIMVFLKKAYSRVH